LGVYLFKHEQFRFARHFTSRHTGLENVMVSQLIFTQEQKKNR